MIVVDRILNGVAVCIREDEAFDVPLSAIGGAVREGAVLRKDGGRYTVDDRETARRTDAIKSRWDRIKKRGSQE
jgi:hypothetical protein